MNWTSIQHVLSLIQHAISFLGVMVIVVGVFIALAQYLYSILTNQVIGVNSRLNQIRLNLGRVLILGLEFIVAADLIGTTTTPDYYAVGLLAIIVTIRSILSFSLNRELMAISQEK